MKAAAQFLSAAILAASVDGIPPPGCRRRTSHCGIFARPRRRAHRESKPVFPVMGDVQLPVAERRLAEATKRAVQAAGGGKVCEDETGLSDTRISCFCSKNDRASISIRNAVRIDGIGAREDGHPHILSAMASLLGAVVIMLPERDEAEPCLRTGVMALSIEVGDVSRAVSDALAGTGEDGAKVTPREAQAALDHIADLERATAKLRYQLEHIGSPPEAPP
ncbi:phage regulatory CII family protein [Sphingomonas aurantiaca]|nr:phage regulatory CII family protein [Sphingomonas aurantiaca]